MAAFDKAVRIIRVRRKEDVERRAILNLSKQISGCAVGRFDGESLRLRVAVAGDDFVESELQIGSGANPQRGGLRDAKQQRAREQPIEPFHTSFLYFLSAASLATTSLTFCACDLCATSVASSVCTTIESRNPTIIIGVRFLTRAS